MHLLEALVVLYVLQKGAADVAFLGVKAWQVLPPALSSIQPRAGDCCQLGTTLLLPPRQGKGDRARAVWPGMPQLPTAAACWRSWRPHLLVAKPGFGSNLRGSSAGLCQQPHML